MACVQLTEDVIEIVVETIDREIHRLTKARAGLLELRQRYDHEPPERDAAPIAVSDQEATPAMKTAQPRLHAQELSCGQGYPAGSGYHRGAGDRVRHSQDPGGRDQRDRRRIGGQGDAQDGRGSLLRGKGWALEPGGQIDRDDWIGAE